MAKKRENFFSATEPGKHPHLFVRSPSTDGTWCHVGSTEDNLQTELVQFVGNLIEEDLRQLLDGEEAGPLQVSLKVMQMTDQEIEELGEL